MKIKVIIPNSGMPQEKLDARVKMLTGFAMKKDTEVSVDCIDGGPETIESGYDEVLAGPHILSKAIKAEKDGFNAIIIYCGSDPAIAAVREVVRIPVIGPGRTTTMLALELGYRVSILTVLDSTVARDTEAYRERGFDPTRLASVRSVNISVANIRDDLDASLRALVKTGKKCIEDGAHCLVLSCLGMAGLGELLQKELGIPVLDPAPVSIKYAEYLVSAGLSQSLLSYPAPPDKIRL